VVAFIVENLALSLESFNKTLKVNKVIEEDKIVKIEGGYYAEKE
jgi:hypothetical protein